MKQKRVIKNLIFFSLIIGFIALSKATLIYADKNLQSEFESFIKDYNEKELIVDNGINLYIGDTMNISKFNNIKFSNNNILKVVNSSEIKAVKEGTVYLSQTINDKVIITEIYVSDKQKPTKSSDNVNSQLEKVSRDYYKVFIDPGHGGNDPGALGFEYRESDINLQVAKKVKEKLILKGIDVEMSRSSDVFYSLAERSKMANSYGADVFVSIHQNSADSITANGIETYYNKYSVQDRPLSDDIQKHLINETEAYSRGSKKCRIFSISEYSNDIIISRMWIYI